MARLLILTEGFPEKTVELRLGVNRFGRGPANDFQIDHATVSGRHCEIELGLENITIRDCDSTNGTYLDGKRISEGILQANHRLRLGDVEFLVDNVDVKIAIPHIDVPIPAPPVVLDSGSILCPKHPESLVTHRCTHCRAVMCDACVHLLRRRGGKTLKLCPVCSRAVQPLAPEGRKKKTLMHYLRSTVKMPFVRKPKED